MTNTTAAVIIGKVSERKGARQHFEVLGRAYCGAGRGTIAADTRWVVDATVATATVCRRCLKALRAALAEAAGAGDPHAAGAAYMLTAPAEAAARDAELAEDIRTYHRELAAQREPAPVDPFYRENLLAELRREIAEGAPAGDLLFA